MFPTWKHSYGIVSRVVGVLCSWLLVSNNFATKLLLPIVALGLAVVAAAIWGAWMLTAPMAELERSSARLMHITDQARQIQISAAGLMTELRGAGSRRASADISAETSDALRSAISDLTA
ncbi:MAG: hypothetical protein AAF293_08220, partial [Pseudomonadota bacterium]